VRPLLGLRSIFRQYIFPFLTFFVVSGKKILEKLFEKKYFGEKKEKTFMRKSLKEKILRKN